MTDNSIIRLETALAHQEQLIHDLEDVVGRQWKEIERLTRRIDRLTDQLAESGADEKEAGSATDIARANRPPHY